MAVTMLAEALPASLANLQLGGAARTIELTLPPGAKLAQMIARGGQQFAKNPAGFLSFARDLVSRAADQGTCVFVKGIGGGGGVSVKWWKSLNATSGA
jgi:hypothetical protein